MYGIWARILAKPMKLRKLNGVRYFKGCPGDVAAASASARCACGAVHGRRETNTTLVCQTEYQH